MTMAGKTTADFEATEWSCPECSATAPIVAGESSLRGCERCGRFMQRVSAAGARSSEADAVWFKYPSPPAVMPADVQCLTDGPMAGMYVDGADGTGEVSTAEDWAAIAYALRDALAEALAGWQNDAEYIKGMYLNRDGVTSLARVAELRTKHLGAPR